MKTVVSPLFLLLAMAAGCASDPAPNSALPGISKNDPVYKYVAAMRDDLSRGKVEIITKVMGLNAEESKIFWPIYQDYEEELFALGDQRLEVIKQFITDQQARALDDKKAAELAEKYFQFESARLDLLKKYHAIIAKDLSPLHAVQFTQVEHRVGTVIDLLVASQLPLIHGKAGHPDL